MDRSNYTELSKQLLSRYLVDKVVRKIDKEYVILDFIESSGEQYIDTGYIPNGNTRVRCKGQILGTASASGPGDSFVAYGSAISYNNRSFEFYIDKGEYKVNYAGIVGRLSPASINDIIEIDHDKNAMSITLNDQTTQYTITSSVVQFTTPVSMYIFASHRPSLTFGGKQRMYYFEIYENGICYRKYIPVMKISTGEVGFYDVISNVFYQNSGTGSFVPGNMQHYIVKQFSTNDYEYDELDYINFISSNKKPVYYDTNIKPSNSFIIKTTFKMNGVTQDYDETTRSAIFGSRASNSFCLFYYDHQLRFDFSNNKHYYPFPKNGIKETDLYEIERNGNIVTFTDVSTNQTKTIELANSSFSASENFYIGSIANQGSEADSDGFKGYFYKTELWKNSTTLLKDLRPCRRNSDGAVGFYDTLSETFLENKGTGLVEAGKVIGHFGNIVPTEDYEKNVPASCKFLASRLGVTPSSNTLDKSVLNANLLKKVIYTFKPGEVFQSSDLTKNDLGTNT